MKKLITGILLTIVSAVFATNEKPVKSSVKNVTVFLQGAQVYRNAYINLSPGTTELVFENVSPYINPKSIQAGGKGNFIIMEVKHDIKYPEPKQNTGELPKEIVRQIKMLEDTLQEQSFEWDELGDKKFSLNMEKDMILKNKLSRGEGKSDSLPMLIDAMDFFRKKLLDINEQLAKIKREEYKIAQAKNRINMRLAELRAYRDDTEPEEKYEPIHRVIVTVSSEEAVSGSLDINYIVSNAGWSPSYDLRSGSTTAPVQLTYKANVYQNTGEEWNDVKLKLSTNNPNRSNIKPVLPTWYVNYFYQTNNGAQVQVTSKSIMGMPATAYDDMSYDMEFGAKEEAEDKFKKLPQAQSSANYAQMVETMTNVEFDIKLSYSIPSDGTTHLVAVKTSDMPASYYHYLVPKMEKEAFLIAKVTGWEELNLLPGKANIFYEGTYVGETMLNAALLSDTMELALGRDNGITVTRTKLPDKERNKALGNDVEKTVTYELKMKNNKNNTLKLVVEDHIPVSQIEDIKVEMKDKGSAEYNDKTGLLKWNTSISSKENKTLAFTYTITYNKDMPLSMH
ncbi:MAG: hypothetical protein POELPBGB_00023 [Bacteroidia bacterium]|nr:hypothetical protein [Bacteroidia bacterium]